MKYYQLKKNDENQNVTDLYIFGDITSYKWSEQDVGAYDLAKELCAIDNDIVVHINSYGGEVAEGLAIYNTLKGFKHNVTTVCDGFACSAASIIYMAGNTRIMNSASLLMIHNAWTWTAGDSNELRKAADVLEKITEPSINVYESVSNLSREEIKTMMDDETWITASEALEYGFATDIDKQEIELQSLEKTCLYKQVMKIKDLETEVKELKQANLPVVKTGWDAFFNK